MGGTIQESAPDVILEGKNLGKKNATTPEEQALAEAQATWEKKQKKGYVLTIEGAQAKEVSDLVEGGIWPMLAKRYDKDGDKIVWPAYCQPKLDGLRCIAMVDGKGVCTLWSRTRKPITGVPHIIRAIEALGVRNVVFDGEAYSDEYRHRFEELMHYIRQQTPIAGHEVVHYHIYDMCVDGEHFKDRLEMRDRILGLEPRLPLVAVQTISVADESAAMLAFERFLAQGYEGAMLRNATGTYNGHPTHRSSDLQKIKVFQDAEWRVVGVTEGRGKLAGHGIFVCETAKGVKFEAKMIGDIAKLRTYWEHPETVIGKLLTVQYQGITNKSGVPRFPVALRIRDE